MTLRFDADAYPGWRPDGPVVVHRGEVHPATLDLASPAAVRSAASAPVLEPGAVRWVVAYGSNACPDRLIDKGLDGRGAVLLPATVDGWVAAFEARPTGYGAVPLTLVPEGGTTMAAWLLGVHVTDTEVVDASEGRVAPGCAETGEGPADAWRAPAGAYRLAHIGQVVVAGAAVLDDAVAFVPGPHTRVQVDDEGRWRTWPRIDQAAAAEHLRGGGPSRAAPLAERVIAGPWPSEGPRPTRAR